jgi:spermidine synthase / saccharopine dehydrogenase (NADP+, L-glutamate-forming)
MTRGIFPMAEYAYTTIPTYPSGQIGFIVCSKESGRDIKTPVRTVKGAKYYNRALHTSAFNLPEFGRVMLEEDKSISPKFGHAAAVLAVQGKEAKKVLLGSGFVARPCAEYIVRGPLNKLTVGELVKFLPVWS